MITIMIISEKPKERELIASAIIGGLEMPVSVISCRDWEEAVNIFSSRKDIDLFVVPIKSANWGGYKLESMIRRAGYQNTPVIFITPQSPNMVSFPKLATYRSYMRRNYISAPVDRLDVQAKVSLYLDAIDAINATDPIAAKQENSDKLIYMQHSGGSVFLKMNDILFAEVQNKNTTVHTTAGDYLIKRAPLENIISYIDDVSFVRCHKSFALNTGSVSSMASTYRGNYEARFAGGNTCPVSKTYFKSVLRLVQNRANITISGPNP